MNKLKRIVRYELEIYIYIYVLFYSLQPNIAQGMYSEHIKTWLEYFPRNQVYIISLNEYSANRAKVLAKIFDFLSLCKYFTVIKFTEYLSITFLSPFMGKFMVNLPLITAQGSHKSCSTHE